MNATNAVGEAMKFDVPSVVIIGVSVPLGIAMLVGIFPILAHGSFAVSGRIMGEYPGERTSCELALIEGVDPLLGRSGSVKLMHAMVGNSFEVGWVTHGAKQRLHVEISCPGYEMFPSPKFVSRGLVELDLGDIRLLPLVERGR